MRSAPTGRTVWPAWLRELSQALCVYQADFPGGIFMPLLTLVIVLIVVGVLLWLVNTYIPMDGKIKSILNAVVVIAVVIWLLQVFGLLGPLQNIKIGRVSGA